MIDTVFIPDDSPEGIMKAAQEIGKPFTCEQLHAHLRREDWGIGSWVQGPVRRLVNQGKLVKAGKSKGVALYAIANSTLNQLKEILSQDNRWLRVTNNSSTLCVEVMSKENPPVLIDKFFADSFEIRQELSQMIVFINGQSVAKASSTGGNMVLTKPLTG